jgi:LCP family protein required for cell wall assembly
VSITRVRRLLGRRLASTVALAAVLGLTVLAVPDPGVTPADATLVKVQRAKGVDVGKDTLWILAVGSDARPGENMVRTRGDALQLVGINTRTGAATSIGIPRDSWVPIPGVGSNRVNAALYYGGPRLLGETVGNLVGIQPDYVFVTRFPFFEKMVDAIGGITVNNPFRFSDPNLKSDGFKAGKIHLNGYDAMAYARIRKGLPNGDFGRSANQQKVLRGIQRTIREKQHRKGFMARGVMTVMEHLHTDLGPAELYRIARAVAHVDPGKVTTCVVQGGIGNVGGASVVLPNRSAARAYGNAARKDATIERC